MRPLTDRGMCDRLRALRDRMPEQGVSNLAHVFVPVGPDEAEAVRMVSEFYARGGRTTPFVFPVGEAPPGTEGGGGETR